MRWDEITDMDAIMAAESTRREPGSIFVEC